ncbi:hypothetical protein PV325_011305 [Microctonus aethiopoides]|uniref:CCC domain-containing protein n=1 Tax=Microctonus aethiopoides TaxID=144406 RepID=A0AA39F6U0_9HYME|nr:hypothetical protein PV326_011174 [Microctonus aethiopoides]KAK0088612.1 hypothetical protein PV325_011305 [Microctonus aethiopoides]KAK0164017.1 hypothetical protein PV328_002688 [Microctonus aethiopoides]
MIKIGITTIFVFVFIFICNLEAITIVDHYPDDDYVLDHEVSHDEAISVARTLRIPSDSEPGCKSCTNDEMTYCKDGSVINDHCCCDSSYNKVFPFVEHTCRVGRQACKTIAENCGEYHRLRECCCHAYLGSVWKYLAGSGNNAKPIFMTIAGTFPVIYLLHWIMWNVY